MITQPTRQHIKGNIEMPSQWNKGRLVEPNEEHVSVTQGILVTRNDETKFKEQSKFADRATAVGTGKGRTGQRSSWNTGTLIEDDVNKATSEANQMDGSPSTPTELASTVAEESDDNIPFSSLAFLKYMDAVGGIESNGNYEVIGGYNNHYIGK